jgi:enoyl-CoA hydratase/carnithine racemase
MAPDDNGNQTQTAPLLKIDDVEGGIRMVTLNRADSYNSLSLDLLNALTAVCDDAGSNREVRVMVIRGAGRGFCAGHDLDEVRSLEGAPDQLRLLKACSRMMQAIVTLPKPVIAQVHGTASAAGCQLVASADLAFAEHGARFVTPGVRIGLFCSTPMVALSRAVAPKHALRMLLTGEPITADEAVRIGLINEAVVADRLAAHVMTVARTIAAHSSYVTGLGKTAFQHQLGMPLDAAYDFCNGVVVENLKAEDAREGISAFLEKRPPSWKDR